MILYFLRHGIAGDRETWTQDDALRPLTKKGKEITAATAQQLKRLDLGLQAVLTSPLVRAQQTAQIVAEALSMNQALVEDVRLSPGFNVSMLAHILADYPEANALMLVGHEPDFSETVSDLIGGGRILFKKGGLARVDCLQTDPLQGELVWLLPPRVLAGE